MCKGTTLSGGTGLDPIEKAIRSAFEKGDPSEREFREKVYRSVFAALDRSLQANPNVTEAIAQRRRETLAAKITEIESEFIPAVHAVEPVRETPQSRAPEPRLDFEPTIPPSDRAAAPDLPGNRGDAIDPPSRSDRSTRARRGWLTPLVSLIALAVIVAGVWWALNGGLKGAPPQPTPPQTGEEPAPGPSGPPPAIGGVEDLDDWITVFDPSDPTTVTAPGDSRAEITEEDGQSFIRIASGASGAPVLFDVGQGVLEEMSGRRAVFAIVASTEDGEETQISVECSLAELGDCGRRRFPVGASRGEFLFEVDLPDGNPGAGGTIAINPDIENGGRSVDIYAIRVSPAGPAG